MTPDPDRQPQPPKIIAVVTMKGGSGKTTLAVCLAGELLYRGLPTAMIDADPQQSARRWAFAGSHLEVMPVDVCDATDGPGLRARTRRFLNADFERIVIDTPGFESDVLRAALVVADLVVVPIKPSPVDFEVAADTMDLVREVAMHRPADRPLDHCLVMSQVIPRSVIARHMRGELIEAGYPVLATELANRVGYAEAPFRGSTPGIDAPNSAAAREISALTDEIEKRLST